MPPLLLTVTDFGQGIRRPVRSVCVTPDPGRTGEVLLVDATTVRKAPNSGLAVSPTSAQAKFAPAALFHLSLMALPA